MSNTVDNFIIEFNKVYKYGNDQAYKTLYYTYFKSVYQASGILLKKDKEYLSKVYFAACFTAYFNLTKNLGKPNIVLD